MRAVKPPQCPRSPVTGVVLKSTRLLSNKCDLREQVLICEYVS